MGSPGGARFELDVHPEKLRSAARKLRTMADDVAPRGEKVTATPGDIGSSWTGRAARSVKQEMRGLGAHLTRFADDLRDSRKAVVRLAERYEEALEEIDSLNEQWEAADADHDAAVKKADDAYDKKHADSPFTGPRAIDLDRSIAIGGAISTRDAERKRLERAFDRLVADVRRDTRTCATALSREVPLPVDPEEVALYRAFGIHGLRLDRSDFNADMPLSEEADRRACKELETPDDSDDDGVPTPDGWDAATFAENWRNLTAEQREALVAALDKESARLRGKAGAARTRHFQYLKDLDPANRHAYEEFLTHSRKADGLDRKAAQLSSKLLRNTPLVGWGITAAGVGYDTVVKGEPVDKTLVSAAAGVAAGAGVLLLAASAPVSLPAIGVAAAAAGAGMLASWGAEKAWDSDVGEAIRDGVKDVGKSIGKGAKSAWKSVFG